MADQDFVTPTLKALTIPSVVRIGAAGAPVQFSAVASDDSSGVAGILINFDRFYADPPSRGFTSAVYISNGSGPIDAWSGTVTRTFGAASPSGTYNITSVSVSDRAGNSIRYSTSQLQDLGIKTDFIVSSAASTDTTPPVLTSFVIPGVIDTTNGDVRFVSTVGAIDEGSGVAKVSVYFDRPLLDSGYESMGFLYSNSEDFLDDNQSSQTSKLTAETQVGSYNISRVEVTDNAGNSSVYYKDQLTSIGAVTSFTVVNHSLALTASVSGPSSVSEGDGTVNLVMNLVGGKAGTVNVSVLPDAFYGSTSDLIGPYYDTDYIHASDHSITLPATTIVDDFTVEPDKMLPIYIRAPGQVFDSGRDETIFWVNLIDNDRVGTGTADRLIGDNGKNYLSGLGGDDVIDGGGGDDRLAGGRGSDVIDGGAGTDTLLLDGTARDYHVSRIAGGYAVRDGYETDHVVNVERISLDGGTTSISFAEFEAQGFEPYAYLAAYADLRGALGLDPVAARQHYFATGIAEGRDPGTFDALLYIAANADLARVFGADAAAGTQHYLQSGIAEGRPTSGFDPIEYAASNPDLARIFGTDRNALLHHYLEYGADEGRSATAFDALEYAASNVDLARTFGSDTAALTAHYVTYGMAEGRSVATFDALEYAASNPDVARIFGTNVAALTQHYVVFGAAEGRATDSFDALEYAATNVDVARALGGDEVALESHYITWGLAEGRAASGFDAVAYLLSNSDLGKAGLDAADALRHWVNAGVGEGRIGDESFGREQASHAVTIDGTTTGAIDTAGDRDWFSIALHAGDTLRFDLATTAGGLAGPLLSLFDARGQLLATDDNNSGPGLDAEIHYAASTDGLYYLVASSNVANATGAYGLTVDSSLFG